MTSLPDILQGLDRARVRYILVGGYASVIHGVPRTTVDMDLALDLEEQNVRRLLEALKADGREVDLLTSLPGMSFEEAWAGHIQVRYRGVEISVISRADQIRLLRATNRRQNRENAEVLKPMDPES